MRARRGQSLSEYAFAGALIVMVCIGVLVLAGGSLLNFGKQYSKEVYMATGDNFNAFGQSAGMGIGGNVPPPGPGEQQVCLKSGYCVNLPTSLSKQFSQETIGGNGNDLTLAFSAVLAQIAAQMAADPNADPYLKDLVTKMANKGHDLGAAEKLVENHPWVQEQMAKGWDIRITANKDEYMNIDGRADVMVDQVQSINDQMNNVNMNRSQFLSLYGQYLNYVEQHPGAMAGGLDGIVRLEAGEIDSIAGTAFGSGWVDTEVFAKAMVSTTVTDGDMGYNMIGAADASKITHQDSNTICSTKGAGCIQGT